MPLLPFALWFAAKKVWREHDSGLLLLLAFLLVPFLLLSTSSAKRIVYLLPLYAPMALLCGALLIGLPERWRRFLAQYTLRPVTLWIAGMAFFLALATFVMLARGWGDLYPLFAIFLLFGCFRLSSLHWRTACGVCAFALFYAAIDTSTAPLLNRDSLRPLFEVCRQLEQSGNEVILFRPAERTSGAAYFYLGRNLREMDSDDPVPDNGIVLVRVKGKTLPGRLFADHHLLLSGEEYRSCSDLFRRKKKIKNPIPAA